MARPIFSSRRERRLWMWTGVVVAAIYSTLGLAGLLAEELGPARLDVLLFVLGMAPVAATVLLGGLQARPGGIDAAVVLGVVTVYLLALSRVSFPERSHLIEYGVVALLVHAALAERAARGRHVPLAPLLAVLATAMIGALDEGIQLFLPARVFDPTDILFNALAAGMAVGASLALRWARLRTASRR